MCVHITLTESDGSSRQRIADSRYSSAILLCQEQDSER